MKKALKLLSLAMLFAMPLAGCKDGGDNKPEDNDDPDEEESSLTVLGEAKRIAAQMWGIEDPEDVVISDDFEEDADLYKMEDDGLLAYEAGYYDDEMDFADVKKDAVSYLPEGAKKDTALSEGEGDESDEDCTYTYLLDVYYKDKVGYVVYADYYEDDEEAEASLTLVITDKASLADVFDAMFGEGEGGDDDWGEDDDDDYIDGEIMHAGTMSDPYSVMDAYLVWQDLEPKEATKGVYVKGTVSDTPTLSGDRLQFHISDGECDEDLQVWNINNIGGGKCTSSTLKKGDEVVVTGSIKAFATDAGVKFELCYDNNVKAKCEIVSINGGGPTGGDEGDDGDEGGGGGTVTPIEGAVVIDFTKVSGTSGEVDGISFESSKAGGQSDPAYRDGEQELRLYAKNTITISGAQMSTIVFDIVCTDCKSYTKGSIVSASTGKISGNTWTGSADSVTFTMSEKGQVHVHSIQIA